METIIAVIKCKEDVCVLETALDHMVQIDCKLCINCIHSKVESNESQIF